MIPTNPFVDRNKQRINRFLNDLCEVGDFYESLEMDQYMALSKKDIVISITPNEIYNTQSLLHQHIDILAPKETDHLRVLVTEVGIAPPQVPRKDNKPIELPLFSRWEIPIQGKGMENKGKGVYGLLTAIFFRFDNDVDVREQYHTKRHFVHGSKSNFRAIDSITSIPWTTTTGFGENRRDGWYRQ